MKTKSTKTRFVSLEIRELTKKERLALDVIRDVLCGRVDREVIGKIPACLSIDGVDRPLVLDKYIVDKIRRDHGNIVAENLVINVHDWDFGIKNMDGNPDRINLIKTIPGSMNHFVVAAHKVDGFFIVTHFEVVTKVRTKLKRLLKRGDALDRFGRTPSDFEEIGSLHVNSSRLEERSSLERFSGVEADDKGSIASEEAGVKHLGVEKVKERLRSPSCSKHL